MKQNELDIIVNLDDVMIANQKIKRPPRISRSDWLKYWERIGNRPMSYVGDYYAKNT